MRTLELPPPTAPSEPSAVPARARPRRRWGVYYTPEWMARGLVRLLAAVDGGAAGRRAIDPACGAGAFVDAALREGAVERGACYGIDRDPSLPARWRAEGLDGSAHLQVADALTSPTPGRWPRHFAWVVGNPPFGRWHPTAAERRALERWSAEPELREIVGSGGAAVAFEWAFVARFVSLAAPDGWIALVVPEGLVANGRHAARRAALASGARLVAALTLPPGAFRGHGTCARTAALVLQRRAPDPTGGAWVAGIEGEGDLDAFARALAAGRAPAGATRVPQDTLAAGVRFDAAYHRPAFAEIERWLADRGARPLGERLTRAPGVLPITYGTIRTGAPIRAAAGRGEGIPLVRGGEIAPTGLDLRGALRVAPSGPWDPARSRVAQGDLLLARSGAGSLGRGRMAIHTGAEPAAVGCFVDRIRFADPREAVAAWWFLKSPLGWAQIRRRANGVGAPNLSFEEIRALLVPVWTPALRSALVRRHAGLDILHRKGLRSPAARAEAEGALRAGIEALLRALAPNADERARLLDLCASVDALGVLGEAPVSRRG